MKNRRSVSKEGIAMIFLIIGVMVFVGALYESTSRTYDNFGDGVVNWSFWKNTSSISPANPFSYTESGNQLRITSDNNADGTNEVWSENLPNPSYVKSVNTSLEWTLSCGNSCSAVGTLQIFNQTVFSLDGGENGVSGTTTISLYKNLRTGKFEVKNATAWTVNITPSGRSVYIGTSGEGSSPYVRQFYLGIVTYEIYDIYGEYTNPINKVINNSQLFTAISNVTESNSRNLTNITYRFYDEAGALENKTTINITGQWNVTNLLWTPSQTHNYTVSVETCGQNATLTSCYLSQNKSFYNYMKFNVKSSDGTLLDNIRLVIHNGTGINTTENPLKRAGYTFTNNSASRVISVEAYDLDYIYRTNTTTLTITENDEEYDIFLPSNQLTLRFNQAGSPKIVNGSLTDLNKTYGFQDSSVLIAQSNLTIGSVLVSFGTNQIGNGNHTQFYEYINDLETTISEDIEILNDADVTTWFKVIDKTGVPVENARIRVSSKLPAIGTWGNFSLIGQRLTQPDGYNYLYSDEGEVSYVSVIAEGYDIYERTFNLADETEAYTKTGAIVIELEPTENEIAQGTWVYIKKYFTNTTTSIKGTVVSPSASEIKIITDYGLSQGLANTTLEKDNYGYYGFELDRGVDYVSGSDFILQLWKDGVALPNITVQYDDSDKTTSLEIEDSIPTNYLKPLGILFLIAFSFLMGTIFRGSGKTTFLIGSIGLMLVSSSFLWLSLTSATYYGLGALRRVIEE